MPPSLTIAPEVARRFLAIRHFLAPPRSLPAEPTSVMTVVDRIGSLQFDPLEVAGRNHDLVLLARIAGYRREWTDALLYEKRALYETYNKGLSLVPTNELPFYRLTWDRNQVEHEAGIFESHGTLVDELLDRIRTGGPMSASDVEPREAIDWFWRPTNQVRAVLEALAISGVLGLARRDGNRRVYDLAERLFPPDILADRSRTVREQLRHRLLSRYRAHGLLGRAGQAELWMGLGRAVPKPDDPDWPVRAELRAELVDEGCIVPVSVDGIRGDRFVVADELPMLDAGAARDRGWRRAGRVVARRGVPRSRSTRSSGTASSFGRATASTTSGRSMSPRRSAAGATTSCRSCSATGWSGGSNRESIGRPTRFGSLAPGGRTASIRSERRGSSTRSSRPSKLTGPSVASGGSPGRGRPDCERSAWRSNGG